MSRKLTASPQLILASRSPRRAELLRAAGFTFTVVTPPFDDPADPAMNHAHHDANRDPLSPAALAQHLASHKVRSLQGCVEPGSVLLAADTIVVVPQHEGWRMLGQPCTSAEAQSMLLQLVNSVHEVVTGVALARAGGPVETFADTARVTMGAVDEFERQRYLAGEAWRGKAGGYNLLELQDTWPISVQGDRTTVVGLPMVKLVQRLRAWSIEACPGKVQSR